MKGVFRTSVILVAPARQGWIRAFRSFKEVPAGVRRALIRSTSGRNAATLVIADQGGRREIAKAMQGQPARIPVELADRLRQAARQRASTRRFGGPLVRLWLAAALLGAGGLALWLLSSR
jgi:hypothetical protein